MTKCNVCLRDSDLIHKENGIFYCSEECYDLAKANPFLFKKAVRAGISLL